MEFDVLTEGRCGYGLYSCGLYSYGRFAEFEVLAEGRCSYGLYNYGIYSYGRFVEFEVLAEGIACAEFFVMLREFSSKAEAQVRNHTGRNITGHHCIGHNYIYSYGANSRTRPRLRYIPIQAMTIQAIPI